MYFVQTVQTSKKYPLFQKEEDREKKEKEIHPVNGTYAESLQSIKKCLMVNDRKIICLKVEKRQEGKKISTHSAPTYHIFIIHLVLLIDKKIIL